MANISKDIQTAAAAKAPADPAPAVIPAGYKRYINNVAKFYSIVIHPLKDDEADAALCKGALGVTGGLPVEFTDWAYATNDPAMIAFIDSRIAKGALPGVSEDATAEVAQLLADAGIELTGTVRATKSKKGDEE